MLNCGWKHGKLEATAPALLQGALGHNFKMARAACRTEEDQLPYSTVFSLKTNNLNFVSCMAQIIAATAYTHVRTAQYA